jgi:SAM-dependent methyltransferase
VAEADNAGSRNPIPDAEYDERARIGPGTRWFWDPLGCQHVARYRFAASLLQGSSILDIACGTGYGSAMLARDRKRMVTGMDVSAEAIADAAATWTGPNLVFRRADALAIDLPDCSIDSVVSFETIEHVRDPARFLEEMARILRPRGRLILSTPDRRFYSPGAAPGHSHNPYHPSEMTAAELLAVVGTRFRIASVHGQSRVDVPTIGTVDSPAAKSRPVADAIKWLTNPVLGRGRIAEALLPILRRRHWPQHHSDGQWLYVVLVCDLLDDPTEAPGSEING